MAKKVKSIFIDLRNRHVFSDRPNFTGAMLLDIARYLSLNKKTKIYFHMLDQSKELIKNYDNMDDIDFISVKKEASTEEIDNILKKVDFYFGFRGWPCRKKRKHFRVNKKPQLVWELGGIYDSLVIDPISIYGDGAIPKDFDIILKDYPINNINKYCENSVVNNISKRTQSGNDKIPDGDFIFIPGQAVGDTSIKKCSSTGLLEFVSRVADCANKNNIPVVFKPHPFLKDNAPRHGKEEQIDLCNSHDNIHIVNNSVHSLCQKALFTATINCDIFLDSFMNQSPIYCCGRSYYINTKAVVYNPNVEEGIQTMIDKNYDEKLMKERQLKTVSWIRGGWLFADLPPEENVRRIEKMAKIEF